jgi:hypothetical protein
MLFRTANKKPISVSEAMPDKNLVLAIGENNGLEGDGLPSDGVTNEVVNDGYLYAVVPLAGKHIAVPLKRNPIGQPVNGDTSANTEITTTI